jgi:hypothetical protein
MNHVLRRSFSLAAAIAGLGLAAAPTLQAAPPLHILPGDQQLAPAVEMQELPDVAPGGSGYLAVWQDQRTLLGGFPNAAFEPLRGNSQDIYATRLDESGGVVDTVPILVSNAQHNQTRPRVAWNGQAWLVVFNTAYLTEFFIAEGIGAVRVSPAGQVLDKRPIQIRAQQENNTPDFPVVTSDGTNWLVAWEEFTGGVRGIKGVRVAPDGQVLDQPPVQLYLDDFNTYATHVDVTFGNGMYLVAWSDSPGASEVKFRRFSPSLAPLDSEPIVVATGGALSPAVAASDNGFFMAWHVATPFPTQGLRGTRIAPSGAVLDGNGINLAQHFYTAFEPDVSWDGSNWFVVYNLDGGVPVREDVFLKRVSAQGDVLDPQGIAIQSTGNPERTPAVASNGDGGGQAVWTLLDPRGDIQGAAIAGDGSPAPGLPLSVGRPRQSQVRTSVTAGPGYMAAYLSEISGESRILAQLVGPAGASPPVTVATGPEGELYGPDVAWNGSVFYVVWADDFRVWGRRLDASGQLLGDPQELIVGHQAPNLFDQPAVAALGSTFLVAGTIYQAFHEPQNWMHFVRVAGDGTILDPQPVFVRGGYELDPRVVGLGGRWLIVWESQGSHDNETSTTLGAFVTPGGSPGAPFSYQTAGNGDDPDVVANGTEALAVWSDNSDFNTPDIGGRIIRQDGTFATGQFTVSGADNDQLYPAVGLQGDQYVAAWVDHRGLLPLAQLRGDIYVARIDAAGNVLDPDGIQISRGPLPEELPDVTDGALDTTLLSYSVLPPSAPENYRIGVHVVP